MRLHRSVGSRRPWRVTRGRPSLVAVAGATMITFLLFVSVSPPISERTLSPASGASAPAPSLGFPPPTSHPIQHVVVIYLENEGSPAVNSYGPYERYLGATYGNLTSEYSACHGSLGNYLAAAAAETNLCSVDAFANYTNTTLGDLISGDRSTNLTWGQFAENLPANICATPDLNNGAFVFRHVPFLFFQNVTKNETYCESHVLDSSYFNGTGRSGGYPLLPLCEPLFLCTEPLR